MARGWGIYSGRPPKEAGEDDSVSGLRRRTVNKFRIPPGALAAIHAIAGGIREKTDPKHPQTITLEENDFLSAYERFCALKRTTGGMVSDAHAKLFRAYQAVLAATRGAALHGRRPRG